MGFFGSYEYFMFIKLKVKFYCYVSMLHYNSISDIRTQETMNKFDISDILREYPFPTREPMLSILCSLQSSTINFGWNSDTRNVIQIFQDIFDRFRLMIKVHFFLFFSVLSS